MADDEGPIIAHIGNDTLQFPAGTSDDVVQKAVKAHVANNQPKSALSSALDWIKQRVTPEQLMQNFVRPMGSSAAALPVGLETMAATAPVLGPFAPLAGAAASGLTYYGMDKALQQATNAFRPSGQQQQPSDWSTVGQLAATEGPAAAISPIIKGAKGVLDPAKEAALSKLYQLNPTFGQILGFQAKQGSETAGESLASKAAKGIENVFAPGSKREAIVSSAQKAQDLVNQEAQKLSKRSLSTLENPEYHGKAIQVSMENTSDAAFANSAKHAEEVKNIAAQNPFQKIPPSQQTVIDLTVVDPFARSLAGKPFASLDPQSQQVITSLAQKSGANPFKTIVNPGSEVVNGPVHANNTLQTLGNFYKEVDSRFGATDEEKPLARFAQSMLDKAEAKFEPTGAVTDSLPMDFARAWEFKKQFDQEAYNPKNSLRMQGLYKKLSADLNNDIDLSIGKWQNGNQQAVQAWKNSKGAAQERLKTFYPEGSNLKLGDFIEKTDDPTPTLNDALTDATKLGNILRTGNLKMPDGTVLKNGTKGDMGGYFLKKLFDDSKVIDKANPNSFTVDGGKLIDSWKTFNKSDSANLLFSPEQRENYGKLFDALHETQIAPSNFSTYTRARLARSGLYLGAGLLGGANVAGLGLPILGTELSGAALGKIMADTKSAKFLLAAVQGKPLEASEEMASRQIINTLKGTLLTVVGPQGQKIKGRFDKDGTFQKEPDGQGPTGMQATQ